jgi:hypothetical protein
MSARFLPILGLLIASTAHASIPHGFAVKNAWRSGNHLLVELEEHPRLASGNRFFWKDGRKLRQLEISWESLSSDAVGLGVAGSRVEDQWIELAQGNAVLHCEEKTRTLEASSFSDRVRDYTLEFLPRVLDPTHLFQVQGTQEYVLIEAPRFDFKGDLKVRIGRPGHWRDLAVAPQPNWRKTRPDKISFQRGGGIFLPAKIDLFSRASDSRGTAVLIQEGKSTELVKPALSRAEIIQIVGKAFPEIRLRTPCESPL